MKKVIITIGLMSVFCCMNVVAQENRAQSASRVFPRQQEPQQIGISISGNRIQVTNALPGSKLEVYNVVGIKVKEEDIKEASGEYVLNIAKGYYIIRIGDVVRKISIR